MKQPAPIPRTRTQAALLDAFARSGCPVCGVVLSGIEHYIESINYEFVNDPGFRSEVEPAWGFCNLHGHQWLKNSHPLGTALIYEKVLDLVSTEVRSAQPGQRLGLLAQIAARLGSRSDAPRSELSLELTPPERCPICRARDEYQRAAIDALLEGLGDAAFRAAFLASSGLCLPHLPEALSSCVDARTFDLLKGHALEQEQQMRLQLREIIRKHDYRFRDEPAGEEQGATERAVEHVAGALGIDDGR